MYFATDITNFLACRHISTLRQLEAEGRITMQFYADPTSELLRLLGMEHERKYLQDLKDQGFSVAEIATERPANVTGAKPERVPWAEAAAATRAAMDDGVDVIYQATFVQAGENGASMFGGRADFLKRVTKPSKLGDWSYEVIETKLARSTKARAIVQLCFYSELLAQIQGVLPDNMHVVLGGDAEPQQYSVARYLSYFRKIRSEFVAAAQRGATTYPEPVEHCGICDWSPTCDEQWRHDDHLSLVANISRNQRRALVAYGVPTLAALGRLNLPLDPKIEGIKDQPLANIHQQARLQLEGREQHRPIHELLLPPETGKGLLSLPPPSPGDMFLDFEGDQFTFEGGLEYLFGIITQTNDDLVYDPVWAMNRAEEKLAFENFIAKVMERRQRYPDMHIYHYGSYEATAIKRMAGQHNVGGDQVDELLRGEVFVDLLRVVRQGLRASVESYSIKKLEPFYKYERDVKLPDANRALATFQALLAFDVADEDIHEIKDAIAGYNRDDCISTLRLRDWLEERRSELEDKLGEKLPRPELKESAPTEDLSAYLERVRALEARLTANLPEDQNEWTDEQRACWLLAQLLEWHRREEKSAWWKYFELCGFTDEQLLEDKSALAGLKYEGVADRLKKSLIHRYRFPLQDYAIKRDSTVHDPKTRKGAGDVHDIDERALTIDIKRGVNSTTPHPAALILNEVFNSEKMRESLLALGTWVADNGIDAAGPYAAARGLLLRNEPRLSTGNLKDY